MRSRFGFGFSFGMGRHSERRAIDAYGDAVMFEAVQECIYEGFSLEEVIPIGVVEVGGDDGGFSPIAFSHEFEEGVDLFGFEGEIAQFIDEEQIVAAEMVDEFRGGAIGERCVEFIDEILCVIESPPVSGKECLMEEAAGQP